MHKPAHRSSFLSCVCPKKCAFVKIVQPTNYEVNNRSLTCKKPHWVGLLHLKSISFMLQQNWNIELQECPFVGSAQHFIKFGHIVGSPIWKWWINYHWNFTDSKCGMNSDQETRPESQSAREGDICLSYGGTSWWYTLCLDSCTT